MADVQLGHKHDSPSDIYIYIYVWIYALIYTDNLWWTGSLLSNRKWEEEKMSFDKINYSLTRSNVIASRVCLTYSEWTGMIQLSDIQFTASLIPLARKDNTILYVFIQIHCEMITQFLTMFAYWHDLRFYLIFIILLLVNIFFLCLHHRTERVAMQ